MNMGTYTFTVGNVTCTALSEGQSEVNHDYDKLRQRHPTATEEELQLALDKYPSGQTMNLLVIETDGTRILLDTGMGAQSQPRYGFMLDNLTALGLTPADIDIVFITHFHGDHINGLVGEDGTVTFPNARHVTSQVEWDTWMAKDFNGKEMLTGLADRFTFVNDGDELAPEVFVLPLPGHTLGHCGLRIESDGEAFTHLVDIVHHLVQFDLPHLGILFDTDGKIAEATRREMFDRAADSGEWVMFYHIPDLGIGHVRREGDGYRFEPGRP